MSGKPFLTIDQQIELLARRGVSADADTRRVLMREGYYSVVNGYKEPFIDQAKTKAAGDDRYVDGTKFSDIYDLFLFDRSLREVAFHYLTGIEVMVRTICSYTFSEFHPEPDAYLQMVSYTSAEDYMLGAARWTKDITDLIKIYNRKLDGRHERHDFIDHYRRKYGEVPLWVLSNALSFGNVEHLFDLMRPEEQAIVCRRVAESTDHLGKVFIDRDTLRMKLNHLVKARNICTHDERLYCAEIGRQKVNFSGVLKDALVLMENSTWTEYFDRVFDLLSEYEKLGGTPAHIIRDMGINPQK